MIGTGISVFIGRGGVSAKTFSRESQRTTLHVGVFSSCILCSRLSRWWLCASAAVGVLALAHVAAPQNLFAGYSNCSARPAARAVARAAAEREAPARTVAGQVRAASVLYGRAA